MANLRSPLPLGLNYHSEGPRRLLAQAPTKIGGGQPTAKAKRTEDISFIGSIERLRDGDVRDFDVSDYAAFFVTHKKLRRVVRSRRSGNYRVIFVNGMQGSPTKFRAQACSVAALSGGPVQGVYNGSGDSFLFGDSSGAAKVAGQEPGNIVVDLIECLTDKLQSTDWDQFTTWFKKKRGDSQDKIERDMAENLSRFNRATGALYSLLMQPGYQNARIVAHSQGNIITCNAINAVAAVRGNSAISSMKVFAVASPVMFWSEAGMFGEDIVSVHALANDLVAWLGANVSDAPFLMMKKPIERKGDGMNGTEISESYDWTLNPAQLLTHNFYAYLEKMWNELRPKFE